LTGGIDKVPDRGSPSRSTSERRGILFVDGRFNPTRHAAARRAAARHLDFVRSLCGLAGVLCLFFYGQDVNRFDYKLHRVTDLEAEFLHRLRGQD